MQPLPPLGLDRLVVVDLGHGIDGNYCTKLLADAGAKVIKVEPPSGDPLRTRRLFGDHVEREGTGSRLFRFLACSKASVVVDVGLEADRELLRALLRAADAVLWQPCSALGDDPEFHPRAIRTLAPSAIVCALTPFGLIGEPARPCNEFTLQAMAGGPDTRRVAERGPLAAGGQIGDWVVAVFAAIGILSAVHRRESTGRGELVDVAGLDALHLTQAQFPPTFAAAAGRPFHTGRSLGCPGIHPTRDGYVGFQAVTGQQWQDFCTLIGRDEWREDPTLIRFDTRSARVDEVMEAFDEWTSARTTDEAVELATLFRLPVAPVGNGETIPRFSQIVERQWLVEHPSGEFHQPEVFYTLRGGACRRLPAHPPSLGADTEDVRAAPPPPKGPVATGTAKPLPYEGLRILDFTAMWAGPIITHFFAMMGADVIHVESPNRPDGYRTVTLKSDMSDKWWEAGPFFAATNTNKRGLGLEMGTEDGRDLARRLVAAADVIVENYSPRVMDAWGLGYEAVKQIKPDIIMVRAPGFGLTGPWAGRVAYGPTIEQACGAAWVTGFPDDRPVGISGVMDPLAGSHAVFATLLALDHRRRTGEGMLVEVPQFTSGLNVMAELVIEYSGAGRILGGVGNRSWTLAPQGAYRCADVERDLPGVSPDDWVAISVENVTQWLALCGVIEADDLLTDPGLMTAQGRHDHHDAIDAAIDGWTRSRPAEDVAALLCAAGVPAAVVAEAHHLDRMAEAQARRLYEVVEHTLLPPLPIVGYPVQFEAGPSQWHRRRSPLLGEHNREILEGLLGLAPSDVDRLEEQGVVGYTAPVASTLGKQSSS